MTLVIAITGGIGSGKSTFSKEFLKKKVLKFLIQISKWSKYIKNQKKIY